MRKYAVPLRKIFWILNVFPVILGFSTENFVQFREVFVENEQFYWKCDFEKSVVGVRP